MKSKTTSDGTHNWFYDPVSGKGAVDYETDNKGFTRRYIYFYGRLDEVQTTIAIPGLISRTFNESYTRDFYGRSKKITYPNGFAVSRNYNANGYFERLMAGDNWYSLSQIKRVGAFGVEEEVNGNFTETRKYDARSGALKSIATKNGSNYHQNTAFDWLSNGSLERRYDYLGPVNTNYAKICAWKFQKHNSKSSNICCQYNEAMSLFITIRC